MNPKHRNPAIILGMSANGLSIARSLGKKGITVIGIDTSRNEPGMYSRYVKKSLIAPHPIYAADDFLSFLLSVGKGLKQIAVLFATADEYVNIVSKHRAFLSPYFSYLLPPHELVECFLDKNKTYELTKKYGIQHPHSYFINNECQLKAISQNIKYPCIIKPQFSHLWREKYAEKKVFVVTSLDELIRTYSGIKANRLDVIIQDIIPGPDTNLYEFMAYYDDDSKPLAYFCCRKLRQYPPNFGIASLSESTNNELIINLGMEFLEKIGHKGLVELEFKVDSEMGKVFFVEANLRTSFLGELSIVAGVDLPYITYKNLTNGNKEGIPGDFKFISGAKLLNIGLDLGSFVKYRKKDKLKIKDWLKSYRAKKIAHTYFSFSDLLPFFYIYIKLSFYLINKHFEFIMAKLLKQIRDVTLYFKDRNIGIYCNDKE
jgi:predicted ATP-grasp superfamily ATP-dependent carboligase